MIKTWKSNLKKLTVNEYKYLREICRLSKDVYNESIYNIRQHYFTEGSYLRYEANFGIMKNSKNYIRLGSNISQQSMRAADRAFKGFFVLNKKAKQGQYERWKVRLPKYLQKDGYYPVVFSHTSEAHLSGGKFTIPVSRELKESYPDIKLRIKIPEYIVGKNIRQISIIPKYHATHFELRIVFDDVEVKKEELNYEKALGIDLGVDNFATCATSEGKSFIIDGRKVKSINQWYNKELARLSSIKDKQKIKGCTKKQYIITSKRSRQISDFIYKSAKHVVSYCLVHKIGNIVVGYNDGFQDSVNLGKVNNQNFVMLPYGQFKERLEYLCNLYGINYLVQEESYTSKANFLGKDLIPKWNPLNPVQGNFTGKRIYRGLYKTNDGICINADVNGALNIIRKSKVVSLETLYNSGVVNIPIRIRLA